MCLNILKKKTKHKGICIATTAPLCTSVKGEMKTATEKNLGEGTELLRMYVRQVVEM